MSNFYKKEIYSDVLATSAGATTLVLATSAGATTPVPPPRPKWTLALGKIRKMKSSYADEVAKFISDMKWILEMLSQDPKNLDLRSELQFKGSDLDFSLKRFQFLYEKFYRNAKDEYQDARKAYFLVLEETKTSVEKYEVEVKTLLGEACRYRS
jgi:hypothetical protein